MTITIYSPEVQVCTKAIEKDWFMVGVLKIAEPGTPDLRSAFEFAESYIEELGITQVDAVKIEMI